MTEADMIEAMAQTYAAAWRADILEYQGVEVATWDAMSKVQQQAMRRVSKAAALAVVQPELDRLRAENEALRRVGNDALTILKFAFNRIHVLPRSRDTELANDIDKVLGRLRAALSAPAHDGEGR